MRQDQWKSQVLQEWDRWLQAQPIDPSSPTARAGQGRRSSASDYPSASLKLARPPGSCHESVAFLRSQEARSETIRSARTAIQELTCPESEGLPSWR